MEYEMEYEIEISFKLKLGSKYMDLKNQLLNICEKNNIINCYFITELEGEGNKINKSLVVASIVTNKLNNLVNDIKKYKEYNIDCIYQDNKILYASSYYLNNKMCKEAKDYYIKNYIN
jgi:hypothetical protein|tara:strand:+ start:929 stop:1282 length:354 start_codon:yes stop_codon:yes gene_type:complete